MSIAWSCETVRAGKNQKSLATKRREERTGSEETDLSLHTVLMY